MIHVLAKRVVLLRIQKALFHPLGELLFVEGFAHSVSRM